MSAPGGIILTPGHKPWCSCQKWGDGRQWEGACNCGVGQLDRPYADLDSRLAAYPWVACEKCGVIEHMTYRGYDKHDPATIRFCFSCQLWYDKLERRNEAGFVVVNGRQFSFNICQPLVSGRSDFLGHAGHRFEIQFFSGRRIVTNNLWCGGDVPLIWRPLFPDNATFMQCHRAVVRQQPRPIAVIDALLRLALEFGEGQHRWEHAKLANNRIFRR